jgi:anti-sigma regulatory factor (Ser/Thr protein kinase)/ActR/RegA family two-component response regulator
MTAANPVSIGTKSVRKEPASRVLLIGRDMQLNKTLEEALDVRSCMFRYAVGSADCLRQLRQAAYDVVITDPATRIEEDLALLPELRAIRPGVRVIVLAEESTPEEVIAALRARVFLVKSAPFDADEIAEYARRAGSAADSPLGIEVLSAHRDWVSLRVNCQLLTAERLVKFLTELQVGMAEGPREELMMAFREILMNAIEHGAEFHPAKVVEVAAVHTQRAIVFYVKDPGAGFRLDDIPHAAVSNPPGAPVAHTEVRDALGMRPGGFGILTAKGVVDELIYNAVGNEVLLIKHTA